MTVVLTDGIDAILIQDEHATFPSLPRARLTSAKSIKQQGRELWAEAMGEPPRPHVKMAVNAKLRRGVRVGAYILAIAVVPDCRAEVEGLQEVLRKGGNGTREVKAYSMRQASDILESEQRPVIQQARHLMERAQQGQHKVDVSVVSGPVNSGRKAAILLHDAHSVLLVRTFSDKAKAEA